MACRTHFTAGQRNRLALSKHSHLNKRNSNSSDVPVDVSITDDNFDVSIAEGITQTKTYEFDTAADSGLLVSAMNPDLKGNVSIEVYENGQLKTQDTDSSGYAQVMY